MFPHRSLDAAGYTMPEHSFTQCKYGAPMSSFLILKITDLFLINTSSSLCVKIVVHHAS